MAEPPERRQPDRYDALRALENSKGETSKEENSKPESTLPKAAPLSAVADWPQSPDMVTQQLRGAFPAMKKLNEIRAGQEADAGQATKPETDQFKAKADELEKKIAEVTMDGKTGDTKAAATETKSKDQIALENLARGIAAEKQNTGQKENTKGKERGDD